MNDKTRLATRRATSNFVRHQPTLFAEAAAWVASLKPKSSAAKKSGSASAESVAYGTVEALARFFFALADQQPRATVRTKQDAYRVILTSWLLTEVAHEPFAKPGSPYDPADRHACLQGLPVLEGREFMRLAVKYALDADPRWHRLVLAAWTVVDPGYLSPVGNSEPSAIGNGPAKRVAPMGPIPPRIARARASYDWAKEHAPELFGKTSNKYSKKAFELVKNPKGGCTVYAGVHPPASRETWQRYISESVRWMPFTD